MAILQLSRITHRKGLAEDLPQLAGGELGWAMDERKLYIGNGEIVDGAPVIGNTEILTEFSNVLDMSSTYTYQGADAGYVVVTGPSSTDITRSLQDKFDEVASVKDFGAVGDGIVDDTDAINRALYELFCRDTNTRVRRALFFPAGTYKVVDVIKVPTHAKVFGDGLNSSIIEFVAPSSIAAGNMEVGKRYAITTVGTTDFTLYGATSNTGDVVFTATGPGTGTGTARLVPEAVVETSDSLQQLGASIGTNSAIAPTGIEMSSMSIRTTEENSLLKLDSITHSDFRLMRLAGPYTNPTTEDYGIAGIIVADSATQTTGITLSKMVTIGTSYAFRVSGDVKGVVLESSGMRGHYKGVLIDIPLLNENDIVLGTTYKIITVGTTDFTTLGATSNTVGEIFTATANGTAGGTGKVYSQDDTTPTGIVIARSIFDEIAYEGIDFTDSILNTSSHNVFYNVAGTGTTPNINMTAECLSVGDMFERAYDAANPTVATVTGGIAFDGARAVRLGSYQRESGLSSVLLSNSTNTLFDNVSGIPNSYRVDYRISDANSTRVGSLTVSSHSTNVTFDDEYTEQSTDTFDITLNVTAGVNSNSTVEYTSGAAQADAIMTYSVVRLD